MATDNTSKDYDLEEKMAHDIHKTMEYQGLTEGIVKNIACNVNKIVEHEQEEERMGGSNDGSTGGGLVAGLVLGSILNRDDRGGRDCGVTNCQNALTEMASDFNAAQHASTLTAIQTAGAASVAATQHASETEQNSDLARAICATNTSILESAALLNTNLLKGFAENALESCKASAITNANIAEVKFAGAISELRTQAQIADLKSTTQLQAKDAAMQLADCCCKLEMQAEANKNAILQQMGADREQALRDELCEERRRTLTNSLNSVKVA